ncbi:Serine/threonine-protein kinase DCLK2 [Acromyrmex echinatior]|uniref:non-specific serine/threonine protein kinase n=1 Tax=Acromyrmex echinatior TaxID=103372 RepID=F4WXJ2_ACREC|nr:Serine/threonine-protein kinase DCLK2 [Acromyrmex echinatior]
MMEELLSQGTSPSSDGNFSAGGGGEINSTTVVSLDERILDITSRHFLNVLRTPPTKKAKRVRFFRNGDKYYTGVVMAVTPERYRSFDSLASDLTRALVSSVTLPNGVRAIYTMDGRKVQSVSDLEDGKCYVVSGQGEMFKKVEYSASKVRRGSSLSGLPQSPAASSGGGGTGRQISAIPLCVKARIVTLIRHGTKPRKVMRLLLNKRNAPSLEHAMEAITEAVKLDTGAVRKVYTLSGQQVTSLEQFFENDDIFVAYGPEKSVQEDFELDFEESKCVQSFRRCPWSSKRQNGPMPRDAYYATSQDSKSSGVEYAMKIVDKYKCQGKETMLASEVAILRQVCHPNIISLIAEQDTADQLFLVMELVKGGDLFDAIAVATKFSEAEASVMISHLTSALAYLHSHHIVHRDIKPENLLVEMDGSHVRCLKLGDFGLAQVVREPLYTVCGTPTYVAPEILAETGYGLKIDVWAAGVILYILLCGFPPFVSVDNEQEELFERILSGQYEFTSPYWDTISDSAKQLISNMLQAQPELRFSAEDVLDHPWLAWFAVSVAVLFLFFCPASVYQQSFLGGEQTAATAPDASAEQYWNQQCKPIRMATFEFDFKKQRSQRQDDSTKTRAEWKSSIDYCDVPQFIDAERKLDERNHDEIDFANGNSNENDLVILNSDYLKDINSLSRSMHDLIDNLNDNKTSRRRLKSQSATSSLNSIPENLNICNYRSNSPIRCNEIAKKTVAISTNHRGDRKNGNSMKESSYPHSNCETPKSTNKSIVMNRQSKCNQKNLYEVNRENRFGSDDFRNRNATASTSSDSLTGNSSTGNDIETSDSFVNIQFARLARGQRSSSTQSMESTDSFENVSFRYTNQNNSLKDHSSQISSKLENNQDQNMSPVRIVKTDRIAVWNTLRLPKLDNEIDKKNCNSPFHRVEEIGKCAKNEPVKLRHERYNTRKNQIDSRSVKNKRYSCFSPCTTKRSSEEVGNSGGGDKVTTRKFSSTDELRDEVRQKSVPRTKRFSLYYTPQPLRKTYENEPKIVALRDLR